MPYPISIVTAWHNKFEFIPDYERAVAGAQVIIIDNGSEPSFKLSDMAQRLQCDSVYIRNDENRGFAAANEQGRAVAMHDILLFLNNDIRATPGWLQRVERDVTAEPRALIGPSMFARSVDGQALAYIEGWCIAGHKAVWETIGGWHPDLFEKPYWEDNYLCFLALLHDIRLLRRPWPIQHLGGQTTGFGVNPEAQTWYQENERTFKRLVRRHWSELAVTETTVVESAVLV